MRQPLPEIDAATGHDPAAALRWVAFAAVCCAYLAVTIGESVLAPVYPVASDELGLDLAGAGLAFALLAGSAAVGNVAGGFLLARAGVRRAVLAALAVTAGGAFVAGSTASAPTFLAAQVLLGLGAGLFFAPGVNAAGTIAGPRRRGLAMGLFGLAFSAGLAVAAVLAAVGTRVDWRLAFWVGGGMAALAMVVIALVPLPPRQVGPADGHRRRLREALGLATAVGALGGVSQYGTVAFVPVFAVTVWDMSPASAALLLAVARVVSAPGKVLAGMSADRVGGPATARRLGLLLVATGLWWTLAPGSAWGAWAAVVFAASVSAVFPVANMLAFEGFGNRGPLLGLYRSVQMGAGAAGGAAIGLGATVVGLRPTLVAATLLTASLVVLARRAPTEAVATASEPVTKA
jgi:predicted MFS family arabinose efflux permease